MKKADTLCALFVVLSLGIGIMSPVQAQDRPAPSVASDTSGTVAPELPTNDECINCHLDVEEVPPDFLKYDVHMKEGLSCVGCHGGDATQDDEDLAKAPETGFIGVPSKADIPKLCGTCHSDPTFMHKYQPRIHTDQEAQYYTSKHGEQIVKGDTMVANCVSCHTAHGVLPASDARSSVYALNVPKTCANCHGDPDHMKGYGLKTTQYDQFAKSVHGVDLLENEDTGAPACNDCHGNHGALPPEVSDIQYICGTCHVNNMDLLTAGKKDWSEDEVDAHTCTECHGEHDIAAPNDDRVGVNDAAVCMDCHDEDEDAFFVAQAIHNDLTGLVAAYDSAQVKQQEVVRIGMDDVDIDYVLKDAHQKLIEARTQVHSFDSLKVEKKTLAGLKLAREAYVLSIDQIDEHGKRREGFGVATLFITLLTIGLFLKLRDMARQKNS